MARRSAILGAAFVALLGSTLTAPTASVAAPMAYRSCSYPKPTKPLAKPKTNATHWRQQGFTGEVRGIDVSGWQHPRSAKYPLGKPIDFRRLKDRYGISFVLVKASDGRNADKGRAAYLFRNDRTAARRAGLVVGPYHYAVPGQLGPGRMKSAANRRNDALLQARLAVRNARGNPVGDLPLTLDFEERPCGWTWSQVAVWARDFVQEVERLTGRRPMIYANRYFIDKLAAAAAPGITWSDYPLWVAMWGPKIGPVPRTVPLWGDDWRVWQFTSDGKLKGAGSSRVDLNVYNGTQDELVRWANGR